MKTCIITEEPTFVTDDDGKTYRACRVLLTSGHLATAFIHDQPGEFYRYKVGDTVRFSFNDPASGTTAGISITGKFGDDFEPVDEKNRETHGPSDGNLVYRSRNSIDIGAEDNIDIIATRGDVSIAGATTRLGGGATASQTPIAIHEEVRADLGFLHDLMDPAPGSAFGDLLSRIDALLGPGVLTEEIAALVAAHTFATPQSEGADGVVANAASEEG